MNWRFWLLVLGVLSAVVGLGVAFVPSLGGFGAPDYAPFALGVAAIVVAMLRTRTWLGHDGETFDPVERERPTGIEAPGAEFDGLLERAPGRASGGNTRLVMARQSLREAAVDALTTYHGHTTESAQDAIADGTWTDDQYAAEFFTTTGGAGNSLSESITSSVYGEKPFHRRADRAAREIERLTRGDA